MVTTSNGNVLIALATLIAVKACKPARLFPISHSEAVQTYDATLATIIISEVLIGEVVIVFRG